MPHRSHEGPSLDKPPEEIAVQKLDLVEILSLIAVEKPNIGELSRSIGAALGSAYVRGVEAGQKLATRTDRTPREPDESATLP